MQTINNLVIAALILIVSASALAPLITPYGHDEISLEELRQPPGLKHPLGTDSKGRDLLSRVLYGGRISLSVALTAAVLSMGIGLFAGLVSGYAGGKTDTFIMLIADFTLAFPSLLLAIGISVIMPPGIFTVMIAISIAGWASFARLIRGYVLSIRSSPFIEAARAVGCNDLRIILVHLFPQCIPLCIVMTGLKLGGYILTEASLSFLGLGAQPPEPSWGAMISSGRAFIVSAPWIVLVPGAAITATALCFNMIGDMLQERYDIKAG